MKVFLSWSGERSKAVAEAFRSWLPKVIQSVEPWISSGIDKGRNWTVELNSELEAVPFGIVCLTRDNLDRPWLLFEAGALSTKANTWTFLFDVSPADVQPPLGQFQHTENEKEDVRKLVHSIAGAARSAGGVVPDAGDLDEIFETFWPKLEEKFKAVAPVKASAVPAGSVRSDREILEEILEVVRRGQRGPGRYPPAPRKSAGAGRTREPQPAGMALFGSAKVRIEADSEEQYAQFETVLMGNFDVLRVRRITSASSVVTFLAPVSSTAATEEILDAADSAGVTVVEVSFE